MKLIDLFLILSKYPLNLIYKGKRISWQSIYEEYIFLIIDVKKSKSEIIREKFFDLKYAKYYYIVDIFKPYVPSFSSKRLESIILLLLYDYINLTSGNYIPSITLLEYEVFIDYVLRHPRSTETKYIKDISLDYIERHYNVLNLYYDDVKLSQDMLNYHVKSISKIFTGGMRYLFLKYYLHEEIGYIFKIRNNGKYSVVSKLVNGIEIPTWVLDMEVSNKLKSIDTSISYGNFGVYLRDKYKYKFNS
jgi:hypothetical protein